MVDTNFMTRGYINMSLDRTLEGRRIELMWCNDPHTKLRPGSRGTIKWERFDDVWAEEHIAVAWDDGSNLNLLKGQDHYKVFPEGEGGEEDE